MAQLLKQSTASQAVLLGPFVDDTDGATPETSLSIANTDIRLSANGGNMAAKNSGGGTHDENGWYGVTFDATDTAAVGRLQVSCKVAGALTVFMDFDVVEEAVYDDLYAASAAGYAGIAELATLDTVAGGIQTDLSNATDGLGALKTLIDAVNTDLGNGTDGLGALKTLIDAVNTDLANGTDGLGALKVLIDAVNTDLGNGTDGLGALKTLIDALNDLSAAQVNTEVADVMKTDTTGEPGQGAPPATASHFTKLDYLFKWSRNRSTQTATERKHYAANGTTVDQKASVSDDGTTFDRGEIGTGP